ncbi:flagellar basal-body rod protein FlgC [Microcella daejeonensis]|uniref:Flagellar basal-body rod protein FlgC n=1 Tax=Microcella daejeonensis TaxID=2994971 RepID=A0A9E8S8L6_9MICO|nr:flagellar basal body rod C-terminal domain-containing protein [Microcella daejeonensis]WAB81740.1 flagellar basal-body rod protein FlgC [Microcella daejeonensis]WAB83892.1 flagellar basal-body rod protein FlgC [Microcella daejeonensis]
MALDAIGIAGTALTVHRKWLDAVSDNMANVNTVTGTDGDAFQARYVVAREAEGVGGVMVAGAAFGDPEGRLAYQPDHPLADEDGMVRFPDIDMAAQMGALIMAQRGYQANAAVVDRARETYLAALEIGRS